MQIESATSNTRAAAASASTAGTSTATTASNQTISAADFMQLLSTEMANQDPLQPMDPTQTMTQLAQMSTLQQSTTMTLDVSLSAANSFLGKQVTIPASGSNPAVTGTVTAIDSSQVGAGGVPQLVINVNGTTQTVPMTSVSNVTAAPAAAATAAAAGATAANVAAAYATN